MKPPPPSGVLDNADPDQDGSFMRLFRYISGANESGQEIAMTTRSFSAEKARAAR